MMKIKLRNLKSSDLEVLLKTENDKNLWIHSAQDRPFSKSTIENYIKNASIQSIFEAKQKRFVITSNKEQTLGFIDLFEYQFFLNKASIGIVVLDQYRRSGIGYESIKLLESYQFRTKVANHLFCKNCGIKSFYKPASHPNSVSINYNSISNPPNIKKIVPFDGKNWEEAVKKIH